MGSVVGQVTCPADIPSDPDNVGNLIEAIDILDVSTSPLSPDPYGDISQRSLNFVERCFEQLSARVGDA